MEHAGPVLACLLLGPAGRLPDLGPGAGDALSARRPAAGPAGDHRAGDVPGRTAGGARGPGRFRPGAAAVVLRAVCGAGHRHRDGPGRSHRSICPWCAVACCPYRAQPGAGAGGSGLGRPARRPARLGGLAGLGARQDLVCRSASGLGHLGADLPAGAARRDRPARGAFGQGAGLGTAGGHSFRDVVRGEPALASGECGCPARGLSDLVAVRRELWLGVDRAVAARTPVERGRRDVTGHPGLAGRPGCGRGVCPQPGPAADGGRGLAGDAGDRLGDRQVGARSGRTVAASAHRPHRSAVA